MSFMKWGSCQFGVSLKHQELNFAQLRGRSEQWDSGLLATSSTREIQYPLFSSDICLKSLQTGLAAIRVRLAVSVSAIFETLLQTIPDFRAAPWSTLSREIVNDVPLLEMESDLFTAPENHDAC